MKKGIVLLAIGDPAYGKFAYNMAISIKFHNPEIKIQLIYENKSISHLSDWNKSFFDVLTEIDKADCYNGNKIYPALAKMSIYKYAYFDENIYLDVDGLCLKDIAPLFEICKEKYYCSQVVGSYTVEKEPKPFPEMQWAKPEVLIKHFDLKVGDVIPALNTSFQYFKKCKDSEALFKIALENLNNGLSDKERWFKWGKDNHQPDELYMNIALAKVKLMPDINPPKVIFFSNSRMKNIQDVIDNHFVLGLYGSIRFTHTSLQEYYDLVLRKIHVQKYGKNHIFKCSNLMRSKIS